MSPPEIADRLAIYCERLFREITRAVALYRIWETFNFPNNPLRKTGIAPHESAIVINTLAQSALNETILIVARSLDRRGGQSLFSSTRVSFPVVLELANQEGVETELFGRAQALSSSKSEYAILKAGYQSSKKFVAEWLGAIDSDANHTAIKLRDFRHDFLAHNLHKGIDPPTLHYADIAGVLPEMMQLCEHASFAFTLRAITFDPFLDSMSARADSLWRVIAIGVDTDRYGSPSPDLMR